MIRKFTLIVLFLFTLGIVSFSQTVSLANVTASPGQNVAVALSVSDLSGIGSITFNIQFDASVMSFINMELLPGTPSGLTAYVTGNTLNIAGSWTSYPTFNDGAIVNLNFIYNGMVPGTLNFLGSCHVTQGVTPLTIAYTNGVVGMAVLTAKATLGGATVSTGAEANVDLTYEGIGGNVGAVTQKVHYDPTKLTFVNVTGTGVLASGLNSSVNSSTGIITITWTKSVGGANINTTGLLNKFILKFVYTGSTSTSVDFVGGCLVSNAVGSNISLYYESGSVSPSPYAAFAVLGSIANAQQGLVVEVPLNLSGFASGPIGGTQSFTLNLPYSSTKLDYVGLKNPVAGLTVSAAAGTLNLAWYNANGPNINGDFVTLKFVYKGVGNASIAFGNNCVFNTNTSGTIGTVQVGYTNSSVVPANATASATLGFVAGTSGSNVLVPLSFTGLPSMGALTLSLTYDVDKLHFVNAQNNTLNANVYETSDNVIHIAWSSATGVNINSKFLDLQFEYNNGGGVASAAVNFADGCEISSLSPVAIIPVNYIDGGVNFLFKVSGILRYNNDIPGAGTPLVNFTVTLKSVIDNSIIATDVTDPFGYYEFNAPNGSYYLVASEPFGTPWYSDEYNVYLYYQRLAESIPLPNENGLKILAGDVTGYGFFDEYNVYILYQRIAESNMTDYVAPDWFFGDLTGGFRNVIINNADMPSEDFYGICSGDVGGVVVVF